ncbi:MAG TPA: hypothetical protein VFC93_16360 [Chloroflexota bacterium]|nr:hypothetical protein [Chloroflexota bacterium]
MEQNDFLVRVRGARDARIYRFRGAEAAELHRLRRTGALERPGGSHRLNELIHGRDAESDSSGDVHFEMVAEDELRGYMSRRLLERKAGREAGGTGA